MAHSVKNLPTVQEMWVQSLGWEDPLENRMATHSSILAWSIPWTEVGSIPGLGRFPGGEDGNHPSILAWNIPGTEEPHGLQSTGSERFRHN